MLCARRRKSPPRIELLEPRTMLSDFGVSVGPNSTYDGNYVWVDVHNLFRTWAPITGTGTIPVNSDNYPVAPATTWANLASYPDGDYQLSYQGTGTVAIGGIGYLAGPITTNSDGVHTGTVVINPDSSTRWVSSSRSLASARPPRSAISTCTPQVTAPIRLRCSRLHF